MNAPTAGRRAVARAKFLAYAMGSPASTGFDLPALGSAASHHVDVRLHGALSVTLGILAIALSPVTGRPAPIAIIGCLAMLGGLPALLLAPRRISARSLTVGHMAASVGNCVVAALAGNMLDFSAGPVVIIIVILHAACLRSMRETWFQVVWALTWYGALLLLNANGPRAFGSWCVLAVTLTLLAVTVTQLRARVDLLVAELRRVAEHDGLTGLLNRQGLRRRLDERAAARLGSHDLIGVLLLDVDHFKRINDEYGHPAGDGVLAWLGTQLSTSAGPPALVSRHGGEEFLIVVPIESADSAVQTAERIRRDVQAQSRTQAHRLTVSIGVAVGTVDEAYDDLVRRADARMYFAKEAGRNRVASEPASPEPAPSVRPPS